MNTEERKPPTIEQIMKSYNITPEETPTIKPTRKRRKEAVLLDLFDGIYKASQKTRKMLKDDHDSIMKTWDIIAKFVKTVETEVDWSWHKDILEGGIYQEMFRDKILDLPVAVINGRDEKKVLPSCHYMNKIIKLATEDGNEKPTLMLVMELAFYLGLLYGKFTQKEFPQGLVKSFKDLKMNQLSNYLTRSYDVNENIPGVTHDLISEIRTEINTFVSANSE